MNKYLNKLNIGMTLCDEYEEVNGKLKNIYGIKDKLELDKNNSAKFSFICDFNFIEFKIPENEKTLSFRFFIRTLGGNTKFVIPFMVSEMGLSDEVIDVMTQNFPMMVNIESFSFPRKGEFAIEVYKYFGKIDSAKENEDAYYYRRPENFVNALSFKVI